MYITETLLKETHIIILESYEILREGRGDGYGGLAIIIHESIQWNQHF